MLFKKYLQMYLSEFYLSEIKNIFAAYNYELYLFFVVGLLKYFCLTNFSIKIQKLIYVARMHIPVIRSVF